MALLWRFVEWAGAGRGAGEFCGAEHVASARAEGSASACRGDAPAARTPPLPPLRIVCVSDTHGFEESLYGGGSGGSSGGSGSGDGGGGGGGIR